MYKYLQSNNVKSRLLAVQMTDTDLYVVAPFYRVSVENHPESVT